MHVYGLSRLVRTGDISIAIRSAGCLATEQLPLPIERFICKHHKSNTDGHSLVDRPAMLAANTPPFEDLDQDKGSLLEPQASL